MLTSKSIIIADLDGCCIDCSSRIEHIKGDDYSLYHDAHHTDKPIVQGCIIYKKFLDDPRFKIVFVTSREEKARVYTMAQLHKWLSPSIVDSQLLMRPDDMYESSVTDTELKPKLFRDGGFKLSDVFVVFEDRQSMVDHWRSLGLIVYQTAARNS